MPKVTLTFETKFYNFDQNNSGGRFKVDKNAGIDEYVIIEASSEKEAISKAEQIGLYFDGDGDCQCCGNRWYKPDEEPTEVPSMYGKPIDFDMKGEFNGVVHYMDGMKVKFHWNYKL